MRPSLDRPSSNAGQLLRLNRARFACRSAEKSATTMILFTIAENTVLAPATQQGAIDGLG